jgi:hypothetical protein
MSNYRTRIIKTVTFLGGIYFFLEFMLSKQSLSVLKIDGLHESISNGFIAVGTAAIGLGLLNLLLLHGSKVIYRKKGYMNSIALLGALCITLVVTTLDWYQNESIQGDVKVLKRSALFAETIKKDYESKAEGVPNLQVRIQNLLEELSHGIEYCKKILAQEKEILPQSSEKKQKEVEDFERILNRANDEYVKLNTLYGASNFDDAVLNLPSIAASVSPLAISLNGILKAHQSVGIISSVQSYIYKGFFNPLGSAMFSLLAMYIASAAYRAFKLRSVESTLLMGAALLVILGQTPLGSMIYEGFPSIRLWLLEVPNSAAFRAIRIGASVAGLVMAIRMWFSLESA